MVFINMGTYMYPMGEEGGGVLSYILDRSVLPRVLKKPWPCRSMRQTKTDSMSLRAPKPGK